MPIAESIASALELSIATLMLLFAGSLLFGRGDRCASAVALAALTGFVGLSVVLSLASNIESLEFLRGIRPSLALLAGSALLVYVSFLGRSGPPPGGYWWLQLAPAALVFVIARSPVAQYTDSFLNLCLGAYCVLAAITCYRRRETLSGIGAGAYTASLVAVCSIVVLLDIILSLQLPVPGQYRGQPAYLAGLLVLLLGAARLMWLAINQPSLLSGPDLPVKYRRSGLDAAGSRDLAARLQELMTKDRLYLNEQVSLAGVAERLRVPARQVSQAVNAELGSNFSAWINEYRVRDAAVRLQDSNVSITEVLYAVGFSSKSSFNREFQRVMGASPRAFRASRSVPDPAAPAG